MCATLFGIIDEFCGLLQNLNAHSEIGDLLEVTYSNLVYGLFCNIGRV